MRTETDAVVLMHHIRSWGDVGEKSVEQRVPITWTACHFGATARGSSVPSTPMVDTVGAASVAGELFACRRCYGLAYASQREASYFRDVDKAQKIRIRLGGSPIMSERFPDKPKGMHWQTYNRLRRHDLAEKRSMMGLMQYIDRQDRRAGGQH